MTKIERLEKEIDYLRKELTFEKAKAERKQLKQESKPAIIAPSYQTPHGTTF